MLKLSIIFVMLCKLAICETVQIKFTKEYETVMNEPFFFKYGKNLITILRNQNFIQTLSTEPNRKMCVVPINQEKHAIDVKAKANILGNGKVVIYGSKQFVIPKSKINWRKYIIHIIDPVNCAEKTIVIEVDFPESQNPNSYSSFVPYNNSFDVFFPTSKVLECNPCRYNDLGEAIEAPGTLPAEDEECAITFVRSIKEFDPTKYFYSCTFKEDRGDGHPSDKTMIRLFNSTFGKAGHRAIQEEVHEVSTAMGSDLQIAICHKGTKKSGKLVYQEIVCDFLGSDLKTKRSIHLNVDKTAVNINAVKILALEDGSAWIATSYAHGGKYEKDSMNILVHHYNSIIQRISEAIEIKRVNSIDVNLHQLAGLFDTNDYCIFTIDSENLTIFDLPKVNVRVKCFDPKKVLVKLRYEPNFLNIIN